MASFEDNVLLSLIYFILDFCDVYVWVDSGLAYLYNQRTSRSLNVRAYS